MAKYSSEVLLLFDIDGTLVRRAGPQHRQALVDAVRAVTGIETTTEGIPVHGMLDTDILREMLEREGVAVSATAMRAMQEEAQRVYDCPDIRGRVCPGVRQLLKRMSRERVPCALVTGNLERIAWRKLAGAGLGRFFLYGAFAGMSATRGGLARAAIRMARRRGILTNRTEVWLIGDAPQDVLAARSNGIRCVAVHTGVSDGRELGRLRPWRLLRDLGQFAHRCEKDWPRGNPGRHP